MDELIKSINEGNINDEVSQQLNRLRAYQVKELANELDENAKLKLFAYVSYPMPVILSLKEDSNVLKILESEEIYLSEDQKLRIIVTTLKDDESKKNAMKLLKDEKLKYLASLSLSKEGAKEYFLGEERKYDRIGLDEGLTIGMEIEAECLNPSQGEIESEDIIEISRKYRNK